MQNHSGTGGDVNECSVCGHFQVRNVSWTETGQTAITLRECCKLLHGKIYTHVSGINIIAYSRSFVHGLASLGSEAPPPSCAYAQPLETSNLSGGCIGEIPSRL